MDSSCARADVKGVANLAVRPPLGNEPQDVTLALAGSLPPDAARRSTRSSIVRGDDQLPKVLSLQRGELVSQVQPAPCRHPADGAALRSCATSARPTGVQGNPWTDHVCGPGVRLPVIMLTTTGARTGSPRTGPVLGLPDGEDLLVIATNFGQRSHPAWYHSPRAHPHAAFTAGGQTIEALATEVGGAERECCLEGAALVYPGFAQYRRRAAHRTIGVFRLSATSSTG